VAISPGSLDFKVRNKVMERLIRALILDRTLYEEVAADSTAFSQAIGVVMLAGIANGMARFHLGVVGAVLGIVVSVVGWLVFTAIIHLIGVRILRGGPTPFRTLACCLGFADIPAVLSLLSVLPTVGFFIRFVVGFWLLATAVVATQAAFSVSRWRGAFIAGLGFLVYLLIDVLVGLWAG